VPSTYPPEPFAGIEISGWASHDHLAPPASHPGAALAELRRAFGRAPLPEEIMGLQSMRALLALGDRLQRVVGGVTEAALGLMQQAPSDLRLVVFAAPHRAGHKLWDATGVRGRVAAEDHERAFEALRAVYRACDAAVGRLAAAAGEQVLLLVFSLHGMGPNTSRAELLPAMLEAVLQGRPPAAPLPRPALQRFRHQLPVEFRDAIKRRLPVAGQDRLTRFWRTRPGGLASRPAFCLQADQQGYVRINQRRRECPGLVEPGPDSDSLLGRIVAGLRGFDADRATPVVAGVEPREPEPDRGSPARPAARSGRVLGRQSRGLPTRGSFGPARYDPLAEPGPQPRRAGRQPPGRGLPDRRRRRPARGPRPDRRRHP
jgi:hypothetical protein